MPNYSALALKLHKRLRGKIEITSKAPLKTRTDLSVAYTPGVAQPCREIFQDKNKVYDYTWKGNTILIVTDGTAVLGLGDIGPEAALPVMEGKSILFKEFGGVDCVPIFLDTKDPDKIIETVCLLAPAYGGVNLEDISAPRCFYIEEELKRRLNIPVFHDDQHGTAIVVLAGLINALKIVKKNFSALKIVFNGIGAAGVAVSKLLFKYGVNPRKVILCDRAGALFQGRLHNMNPVKEEIARLTNGERVTGNLAEAIKGADVFIGLSSKNVVTVEMAKTMNKDAIIFAMANPDPEITPADAKKAGVRIVATGRSDFPNQVNNVLAFPGLFRGVLDARACAITDEMKIAAAEAIAGMIKKPKEDEIIPSALDKSVVQKVARAVKRLAI
jgi:malate dehydrogenase (oxaloacetate-decarboxylating)